jgi:hypothetical protein
MAVMTEEQKARMAEGKRLAKERREAEAAAQAVAPQVSVEALEEIAPLPMGEHEEELPDPGEIAEPEPQTPYDIYLASLPDDARELLTDAELRQAFEDAERDAREERRKRLRQQARDRAKAHAQEAHGLTTPEEAERRRFHENMNRKVRIKPQLPFVGETGGVEAPGITIDGVTYYHGQEYVVPMGRALDIRRSLYCMQQNELDFEGKGRLHGLRRQQASNVNMVRI